MLTGLTGLTGPTRPTGSLDLRRPLSMLVEEVERRA
jgi:hypothetical protein